MRKAGIYLCAAALAMPPPKWYDGNEQKKYKKGVFHMAKKTKTQPKARKTITSNNLADLSKLVQALKIDDENPENQQKGFT